MWWLNDRNPPQSTLLTERPQAAFQSPPTPESLALEKANAELRAPDDSRLSDASRLKAATAQLQQEVAQRQTLVQQLEAKLEAQRQACESRLAEAVESAAAMWQARECELTQHTENLQSQITQLEQAAEQRETVWLRAKDEFIAKWLESKHRHEEEVDSFNARIDRLHETCLEHETAFSFLEEQLTDFKTEAVTQLTQAQADLDAKSTQARKLTVSLADLDIVSQQRESEIVELRESLAAVQQEAEAKLAAAHQAFDTQRSEVNAEQTRAAEQMSATIAKLQLHAQQSDAQRQQLQRTLTEREAEWQRQHSETLRDSLAAANTEAESRLAATTQAFDAERSELNAEQTRAAEQMSATIAKLQLDAQQSDAQRQQLQKTLAEREAEWRRQHSETLRDSLAAANTEAESRLATATQAFDAERSEFNAEHTRTAEQMSATIAKLQLDAQQSDSQRQQLQETLTERQAGWQRQHSETLRDSLAAANEEAESRLAAATQAFDAERSELNAEQTRAAEQMSATIAKLQLDAQQSNAQREQLQRTLTEREAGWQRQHSETLRDSLAAANQEAETRLAAAHQAFDDARSELEAKHVRASQQMCDTIARLQLDAQQQVSQRQELQQQLTRHEAESERQLREANQLADDAQTRLDENPIRYQDELDSLAETIDSLNKQLAVKQAALDKTESELADREAGYAEVCAEWEREYRSAKEDCERRTDEAASARNQAERYQLHATKLQQQLEAVAQRHNLELTDLRSQLAGAESRQRELEATCERQQTLISQRDVALAQREPKDIEKENVEAARQAESWQRTVDELAARNQALQTRLQSVEQALVKVRRQRTADKTKNDKAVAMVYQLKATIAWLEENAASSQKHLQREAAARRKAEAAIKRHLQSADADPGIHEAWIKIDTDAQGERLNRELEAARAMLKLEQQRVLEQKRQQEAAKKRSDKPAA